MDTETNWELGDNKPAPNHKWCEVHQDALLASRGYYRLSSTIMLIIICLQKWESGTAFYIMLPLCLLLWKAHQFAGRKIEDKNYLHSQEKWEEEHVFEKEKEDDLPQ